MFKNSNTPYTVHDLHEKLYDFVVFDIETTGGNRETDRIIQLSAVKVRHDQIENEFNTYVNPHKKIPARIKGLTGILDSDVQDAPEIGPVMSEFQEFIEDLPLLGHNIKSFDLHFIYENGLRCSDFFVVDTKDLANEKRCYLNTENIKLETLKDYYGIVDKSHDSLCDCRTNLKVYQNLRDDNFSATPVVKVEQCVSNELTGLKFAVSGAFHGQERTTRAEVILFIENHGGKFTSGVSKLTDFLIDGTQIADNLKYETQSVKEKKAEEIMQSGGKIKVIDFLDLQTMVKNYGKY